MTVNHCCMGVDNKAEVADLKALVRVMAEVIGFTALALELHNPNSTLVEYGFEIIARPDVKAITEAPE